LGVDWIGLNKRLQPPSVLVQRELEFSMF